MWITKKKPVVVEPQECCKTQPVVMQTASSWISVEDQVPEFGVRVLVYAPDRGVISGHRETQDKDGSSWRLGICEYSFGGQYQVSTKKVTHWQPLPSAPRY